jgi:hypothetical protein
MDKAVPMRIQVRIQDRLVLEKTLHITSVVVLHHIGAEKGPVRRFTLMRIRIRLFNLVRMLILLFTLMRIRIRLFTLMRIKIRYPKMMRIYAD